MSSALPFDERNAKDYSEITKRVREALDKIERNENQATTKSNLASLSGIHRNTLYNRAGASSPDGNPDHGWPLSELNRIKERRKRKNRQLAKVKVDDQRSELDAIRRQLEKSRFVVSVWFHRAIELKRERDQARRQIDLLVKQTEAYRKDIERMRKQRRATIKVVK